MQAVTVDHGRTWLTGLLRESLPDRGTYRVELPAQVRARLRKPKKIRVSEWAEKYRVLTKSAMGKSWSNEVTPYLRDIMDVAGMPYVEEIVGCKAVQVGFTEAVVNWLLSCMDQDQGDVLMVYPDDETAEEVFTDRIRPSIESSRRLSRWRTGANNDMTASRVRLAGMTMYMASARSATQLGSKPLPYVVFDEIDKYPDTSTKRETSPIALGTKRATTYKHRRKIWKFSTPTTEKGNVWRAINHDVQAVFHFFVRCPHCGKYQMMTFKGIKWEGGSRADAEMIRNDFLARYECAGCGALWTDRERDHAVRDGQWRDSATETEIWKYMDEKRPRRVGFHVPAWISPFVSLSESAHVFLKGQSSKVVLRDFFNNYAAEPWKEYETVRPEEAIFALRDDRPRGVVPGGGRVQMLAITVDTQDNGFWYEVRAWGYGMQGDSWQVREGFLAVSWQIDQDALQGRVWPYHPAFDPLREVLETVYVDEDGTRHEIQAGLIDAMGHHTTEVYEFCRVHRMVAPFQGKQRQAQSWTASNIDKYPGTNRVIPGGIRLIQGNVTYFKDRLSERLEVAGGDPGAWNMHADMDGKWAAMMTAEYRDERGLWVCPDHKENHGWDVSVYQLILAEMLMLRNNQPPEPEVVDMTGREEPEYDPRTNRGVLPSWRYGGR